MRLTLTLLLCLLALTLPRSGCIPATEALPHYIAQLLPSTEPSPPEAQASMPPEAQTPQPSPEPTPETEAAPSPVASEAAAEPTPSPAPTPPPGEGDWGSLHF